MRTALSIAGSDSSGGAGIQADLKTMTMNGVFVFFAITALTAQNTTGVTGIFEVSPEFLGQQLDAVFTDIRPDAVKIGMVSSSPLIEKIAERLRFYQAENIVLDPVMAATSGSRLIAEEAVETLKKVVNAAPQSGTGSAEQRRANISGAFECADEELVRGRRILLIDDIITTGATVSECARVLGLAGAESVVCAAVARGRP